MSATSCRYCTEASWHNFQAEFQNRQVLFFPASLYLALLQQGVADLGLVSLLIMDEVHQATKEHPMSSILKDFHWNLPSEAAPKVLLIRPCNERFVHCIFSSTVAVQNCAYLCCCLVEQHYLEVQQNHCCVKCSCCHEMSILFQQTACCFE